MHRYRIVADSSADIHSLPTVAFAAAPLKIITAEREFTDNAALDVQEMVQFLAHYKGKSSTSCPNPDDWMSAFGDAQYVFCVTLTGSLSGSYNAALIAKEMYEEQHPDRRVCVINSLSTGPEMNLLIEKLETCILEHMDFYTICAEIDRYSRHTKLLFMLSSMKNLANNGRVSPLAAKAAGLLGIRVLGKASDAGELEMLDKVRGEDKILDTIVARMREMRYTGKKVRISHCFNETVAQKCKDRLCAAFPTAQVNIYPCRGLCSFYAEQGGMLIGFEVDGDEE